jgi:hypothetical protein
LFGGLEPFHESFARVGVALDDGHRTVFERERGSVFQEQAAHRAVASRRLVVDRDARPFHARLQDGNKRGAVAPDSDGLRDLILEEVAHFAAFRRRFDARVLARDRGAQIHCRRRRGHCARR